MNQPVDLSIRQFSGAWRAMCGPSASRTITTDNGLDYVFSGLPIAFFNIALVIDDGLSADRLADHGRRACSWAAGRDVPWMFIVTHEALGPGVQAAAVLDGCGLAPLMPLTGMIAEDVAPSARAPAGLEFRMPSDDLGCAALLDVNAAAYGMDLEAGKAVVGRQSFWVDHVPMLGLTEGKATSCAAVLMVDGYRYVAMVATDPGRQRRGHGAAVMREALEVAARTHGRGPSVLHATEAGRPVYERMGYRTISNHTVFMEKRFLAEH